MEKNKVFVFFVCLIVLGFLMVSCSGNSNSAFVGKWYLVEGKGNYIPEDIELLKDGTGFALNQAVTWKTEKDRLFIIHPDLAMAFSFQLTGARLDLKNDNGDKFAYIKQLGGTSAIIGAWQIISVNGEQVDDDEEWLFNNDGTAILFGGGFGPVKWLTDKDVLYTIPKVFPDGFTIKYTIKGDTLQLNIHVPGGERINPYVFKKK